MIFHILQWWLSLPIIVVYPLLFGWVSYQTATKLAEHKRRLQEIAQTKAADMTGADIEAMTRSIEGTARSMGLVVED